MKRWLGGLFFRTQPAEKNLNFLRPHVPFGSVCKQEREGRHPVESGEADAGAETRAPVRRILSIPPAPKAQHGVTQDCDEDEQESRAHDDHQIHGSLSRVPKTGECRFARPVPLEFTNPKDI